MDALLEAVEMVEDKVAIALESLSRQPQACMQQASMWAPLKRLTLFVTTRSLAFQKRCFVFVVSSSPFMTLIDLQGERETTPRRVCVGGVPSR